ncbi:MAG: DUF305 domain-containing protein [Propionicimonas sp.]
MNITRLALITVVPTALLALLTACAPPVASPTGTTATPSVTRTSEGTAAVHNEADTTFAQMMVIHHEGAIEMAGLAEKEGSSSAVRSLAGRIRAAQGPEIDQMRGWLTAWGEPAPEDSGMAGMGHEGMDMGGLDQQAAMDQLMKLNGEAFDKAFLTLMIQHHQGALTMATQEVDGGENADAIALATTIIAAQQKEIAEMQALS